MKKNNRSIRVKDTKPRWKGHNYQRMCIARGFTQKFIGYFLDPG